MSGSRTTVDNSMGRFAQNDHLGILRNQKIPSSRNAEGSSLLATAGFDNPPKRTSFSEDVPSNRNDASRTGKHFKQDESEGQEGYFFQGRKTTEKRNSVVSIDSSVASWNKKRAESCSCLVISDKALQRLHAIDSSTMWKILIFLFTFILLFGSAFQEFCPNEHHTAFDSLFMITLGFLLVDILINVFVRPKYFNFQTPLICRTQSGSSHESNKSIDSVRKNNSFQIGSLLFWFDLIGSLSILFEVQFINPSSDDSTRRYISVNDQGGPIGMHDYKSLGFLTDFDILLNVIVRTARVARFIRASTVFAFTSKLNFYRFCKFGTRRHHYNYSNESTPKARALRYLIGFDFRGRKGADEAASTIQRSWRNYYQKREKTLSPKAMEEGKRKRRILKLRKTEPLPFDQPSRRQKSQRKIGIAMNDITMSRIALGIVISVTLTVLFTYHEIDSTFLKTMTVLHTTMVSLSEEFCSERSSVIQTQIAVANWARKTSTPNFYDFSFTNANCTYDHRIFYNETSNTFQEVTKTSGADVDFREKHILEVHICGREQVPSHDKFKCEGSIQSTGMFDQRTYHVHSAVVSFFFTLFLLLLWLVGVTAFIGPVTTLIVFPIERMVRLLDILVKDPVAYSNNKDYKQFISEDSVMMNNSPWTKDVLNGMETSFLMSTILRIGSLMKVGFGTAGVEIIKGNLDKTKHTTLGQDLNKFGSTVSSIFMFCDIRQFTDATGMYNSSLL